METKFTNSIIDKINKLYSISGGENKLKVTKYSKFAKKNEDRSGKSNPLNNEQNHDWAWLCEIISKNPKLLVNNY